MRKRLTPPLALIIGLVFLGFSLQFATAQQPGGGRLTGDIVGGAALIFRAPQNPTVNEPSSRRQSTVGGGRTSGRLTKPPVREQQEQHLARANAARKASKPKEAEEQYREAMRIAPTDARAFAGLGNVYVDQARFKEAVDSYRHAIQVNPNYQAAYLPLAFSLARLGSYDEAIPIYEKLKEKEPTNPEVFNNLGFAYNEKGRYQESVAIITRAIELLGDTGQAYTQGFQDRNELLSYAYKNLGNAYNGLGKYEEAATALKRSTTIVPANAAAYFNLGLTLYNAKRYSEAIEAYQSVLKLRPSLPQAHYNLGLTFVAINDQKSAREQYDALRAINSDLAKQLEKLLKN